jgi:hypothetical protein
VTETGDSASATGSVCWQAVLSVVEVADTASFSAGSVASGTPYRDSRHRNCKRRRNGMRYSLRLTFRRIEVGVSRGDPLAANEAADTCVMLGGGVTLRDAGRIEAADTAALTGGIYGTGTLVAVEPQTLLILRASVLDSGAG